MPYSEENLAILSEALSLWTTRLDELLISYSEQRFRTSKAQEYARHGFGRRVRVLKHCILRTFEVLPPSEKRPEQSSILDATIFIQAFLINIYGSLDNLTHIWCHDNKLLDKDGNDLPNIKISLFKRNGILLNSLPNSIKNHIIRHREWFDYLEEFRHSLAHRIPLYIPRNNLDNKSVDRYRELEEIQNAARKDCNFERVDEIFDELEEVGIFEPWFLHSYSERSVPMRFHAQMICDIATVVELGQVFLMELRRA